MALDSLSCEVAQGAGLKQIARSNDWYRTIALLIVAVVFTSAQIAAQEDFERGPVIRSLKFEGNHAIDDFTLRLSIRTSQSSSFARWGVLKWVGWGSKRYFDEADFRRDSISIDRLYWTSGYRDVSVRTEVRPGDDGVYLRVIIDEGRPIRVTSVMVNGLEGIVAPQEVLRDLPIQVGDPLNGQRILASRDSIKVFLRDRGYPDPDVDMSTPYIDSVRNYVGTVVFDVRPKSRARVTAVEIEGADQVSESVIRKAMSIEPGQWFSGRDLYTSQIDLYRTNLFNYVEVGLVDSLPLGVNDSTVAVRVRVTEAPLAGVRLGAGYGTIDCFRTLGAWTRYDFLGGGRTFEVSTRLSKIGADPLKNTVCWGTPPEAVTPRGINYNALNYTVAATLREPFLLSRRTSASLSFTAERYSEINAYVREWLGGELALTWQTPLGIPLTASYGLSKGRTDGDPANLCFFLNVCFSQDTIFTKRRTRSEVGLSFTLDRSNSPLDPTRGTRLVGELRHASTAIKSDSLVQFTRGIVEFASYHRVARRSVFAWRIRFAAVAAPTINYAGQQRRFIPPEDRLYAGGPNSVRGFGYNELGPFVRVIGNRVFDPSDVVNFDALADSLPIRRSATGGDRLVLASEELRFPMPFFSERVVGALFVDAGQVYEHGRSDDELLDIHVTPGAGFRVVSPLGPMRFDVAYNPYPRRLSVLYGELNDGTLGGVQSDGTFAVGADPYYFAPETGGFLSRLRLHFSVGQAF